MEDIGERLKTEFPQSKLTQRMQDLLHQLDEAARLANFDLSTGTQNWLRNCAAANFDGGLQCTENSRAPISWNSCGSASVSVCQASDAEI
jgi:hypothetical protein